MPYTKKRREFGLVAGFSGLSSCSVPFFCSSVQLGHCVRASSWVLSLFYFFSSTSRGMVNYALAISFIWHSLTGNTVFVDNESKWP